jgi:hypothetical protein
MLVWSRMLEGANEEQSIIGDYTNSGQKKARD